jgi:hypothetical protein
LSTALLLFQISVGDVGSREAACGAAGAIAIAGCEGADDTEEASGKRAECRKASGHDTDVHLDPVDAVSEAGRCE